ncbi:ACP S-malonyltransferase [Robbsia andropogonis]|uniref:ACP S-malonyltransferase n=1 Tax=Robbsia andropogonis TaxID=28092 RepID=UPI0009DCF27B|nr:ACP S-malonyltransferase [Robbsia andropogonis]
MQNLFMKRKSVFLISGQGSQYYRMGARIYAEDPVFREWMDALDTVTSDAADFSVSEILYKTESKPSDAFSRTLHTHAALFTVQFALAQALIARGVSPAYLLGSSLGEYVAAALADVISPEVMLRILLRKAESAERHCEPGGMLAVFHHADLYDRDPVLYRNSTLAAVNHAEHFVVSGLRPAVEQVHRHLRELGVVCLMLPISHGFHSSAMDPCLHAMQANGDTALHLAKPRIPLISCLTGGSLDVPPPDYFWQIGRRPILFREAVEHLQHVNKGELEFIDIGPGATLSGFLKRLLPAGHPHFISAVMPPYQNEVEGLCATVERSGPAPVVTLGEPTAMHAYIFPGQGSQAKGMGKELFAKYPDLVASTNRILGYSITELCLDDPRGQLNQTLYTQPALYVVNALSYLAARASGDPAPAFVAGHSLGEYAALFAAGMVDFKLGLRLVLKRATLMSQATSGGMAAVLGMDARSVRDLLDANGLVEVDIANLNTPSQNVISGLHDSVAAAKTILERATGCNGVVPLPVSGAFHSRLMRDAQVEFERFLAPLDLAPPQIPVISNVTARPYDLVVAKRLLADQITHSVNWVESVRYMWGQGVEDFRELGHGRVLSNLVKKIKAEVTPLKLAAPLHPPAQSVAQISSQTSIIHSARTSVETPLPVGRLQADEPFRASGNAAASTPAPAPAAPLAMRASERADISAASLGCAEFKTDYGLTYAYVAGAMVHGIASVAMVVRMARAGMLAFFGTGGLMPEQVEQAIVRIAQELGPQTAFGLNLPNGSHEEAIVALLLKHGVRNIEASAYMQVSPSLVLFRLRGLQNGPDGRPLAQNRIMAKLSRPEVAACFLSPAPPRIVDKLLQDGAITSQQAAWACQFPMADDICVEADSGGHTDSGVAAALLPVICRQRDNAMKSHRYAKRIRVGSAGGIGTAETAASAFVLGADFIVTGSINQCTVEAGTSDAVKDLLQEMEVQDTGYAPAGDMFETGARVQVFKRGVFFPARANKLYDVYRSVDAIDKIDEKTAQLIQDKYFRKSFEQVYDDCRKHYPAEIIDATDRSPKKKMALIFKWYFGYSNRLALKGDLANKVDFQIHCGPALGGFNASVKGTSLESWRNRHVDGIGIQLMEEAAALLSTRFAELSGKALTASARPFGSIV